MGRSPEPPCFQGFNTEVTEILRALRVEALMATEYREPLGDDVLIGTVLRGISSAMFVILAEPIHQLPKCLAAVRHRKFFFGAQLRESLAERRIEEKRVVAEPARPST